MKTFILCCVCAVLAIAIIYAWVYIIFKPTPKTLEEDLQLREIQMQCNQIQILWDAMTDIEKEQFSNQSITHTPKEFSYSLENIEEIPEWCFR